MTNYFGCKCTPQHSEADAIFDCPYFKIEIDCPECGFRMVKNKRVKKLICMIYDRSYTNELDIFGAQQWDCQNLKCQNIFGCWYL